LNCFVNQSYLALGVQIPSTHPRLVEGVKVPPSFIFDPGSGASDLIFETGRVFAALVFKESKVSPGLAFVASKVSEISFFEEEHSCKSLIFETELVSQATKGSKRSIFHAIIPSELLTFQSHTKLEASMSEVKNPFNASILETRNPAHSS
jgi:hypothetical protein